jgi:hypothetical protein
MRWSEQVSKVRKRSVKSRTTIGNMHVTEVDEGTGSADLTLHSVPTHSMQLYLLCLGVYLLRQF